MDINTILPLLLSGGGGAILGPIVAKLLGGKGFGLIGNLIAGIVGGIGASKGADLAGIGNLLGSEGVMGHLNTVLEGGVGGGVLGGLLGLIKKN
jgi:hypothetical protein